MSLGVLLWKVAGQARTKRMVLYGTRTSNISIIGTRRRRTGIDISETPVVQRHGCRRSCCTYHSTLRFAFKHLFRLQMGLPGAPLVPSCVSSFGCDYAH